jgi:hypothetical protein
VDDLATAQERLENAGRTTGELLIHCKNDPEAIRLLHRLINQQAGALNSIRFARRTSNTR